MGITNATARIPGVDKSSDSPWGSGMSIRGLGRNSVVFLVDGCRVNTATDINARFGLVNPLDIEQIEVLKGPISSLYGSGSTGGVVNVITRRGKFTQNPSWTGEISNTLSSNPRGNDSFGFAAYNGRRSWVSASAGFRDHESYESGSGDEINNSQFEDLSLNAGLGLRINSINTTRFQVQHLRGDEIGIPGMGLALPTGTDVTYPDTNRTLFNITHTLFPDTKLISESSLNLFYQTIERRVRIDNFPEESPVLALSPGADHSTWGAKWQNTLTTPNHTVVAGLDIWNWEISNSNRYKNFANGKTGVDASLADVEQLSWGLFLEDE
jgi:hemoglobin/transferrin/lactoferrin receptor protein